MLAFDSIILTFLSLESSQYSGTVTKIVRALANTSIDLVGNLDWKQ